MDVELPARWADEPARLAAVRLTREFTSTVEPVPGDVVRIAADAVPAPMSMLTLVEAERYAVGPLTFADPGARSHAGVPLLDTSGNLTGALSVRLVLPFERDSPSRTAA